MLNQSITSNEQSVLDEALRDISKIHKTQCYWVQAHNCYTLCVLTLLYIRNVLSEAGVKGRDK